MGTVDGIDVSLMDGLALLDIAILSAVVNSDIVGIFTGKAIILEKMDWKLLMKKY